MNETIFSRRTAMAMLAGTAAMAAAAEHAGSASTSRAGAASGATASRLRLLGTGGGPVLGGERSMSANVIEAGGRAYLIDCGYGAAGLIAKAGMPVSGLDRVFITHNHADHMLDYGSILFFSWLGGRTKPIDVHGAAPLAAMTRNLLAANQVPLDYYRTDMKLAPMPDVRVHEQTAAGLVMDDGVARVTCCLVEHPPVVPSFAYRFDLSDRSIVFSGDTAPSEAVVALARGADVLVHEATEVDILLSMMRAAAQRPAASGGPIQPRSYDADKFRDHVVKAHTSAEDAGRIAQAAGVRTLVLNHLSPGESRLVPDTRWIEDARKHFRGEVVVAHDGMTI